jgi:hypothetical protein
MARRDGMDTSDPTSLLWRVGSEPHGEHDNYGVNSVPKWGLLAVIGFVVAVLLVWGAFALLT